jgi:hypothetical protein
MGEALMRRLVREALTGDMRAMKICVENMRLLGAKAEAAAAAPPTHEEALMLLAAIDPETATAN